MGRRLLAVDFSNLLYRQASVHRRLSAGDVPTGGLYGFLDGLTAGIKKVGATDVVICQDAKPYRRSLVYPEYKLMRSSKSDPELKELYNIGAEQVARLIELLGIPRLQAPGFEADDMVGSILKTYHRRFERIVAQSTDADLMTLLDYDCFRIMKAAKDPLVGREELAGMMFGATPAEYHRALALAGTHNEVAGIPGIAMVRALQALRDPVKLRALLADHQQLYDRNLELIRLPHRELAGIRLPPKPGRFDLRGLYRFLAPYEINLRPDMAAALEQVLT